MPTVQKSRNENKSFIYPYICIHFQKKPVHFPAPKHLPLCGDLSPCLLRRIPIAIPERSIYLLIKKLLCVHKFKSKCQQGYQGLDLSQLTKFLSFLEMSLHSESSFPIFFTRKSLPVYDPHSKQISPLTICTVTALCFITVIEEVF